MTNIWDWFNQGYYDKNPEVRQLPRLFHDAWDRNETDPQECHSLLLNARSIAEREDEPWWVLFFDYWRCILMWARLDDLHSAQRLGIQMTVDAKKPLFQQHPLVPRIYNQLVSIFTYIDPLGYQDRIIELMKYLETDIEIDEDIEYLLLANRANLAFALDDLASAEQWALKSLDRIAHRSYYAASAYSKLSLYCYIRKDYNMLAEYVSSGEEEAHQAGRKLIVCEMLAWRALLAQMHNDFATAQRHYLQAVTQREKIGTTPTFTYHDVICDYLERNGKSDQALTLRNEQLETLSHSGLYHEYCECHLVRCRLLGRMGLLSDEELSAAKTAGEYLLKPERYLEKISQIEQGNYDNWWGF